MLAVLDTNVLVSGLRSRAGASFAVLESIGTGAFDIALSVPLLLEYEDAATRARLALSATAVAAVLDYMCSVAIHQRIHFLWRPFLSDPKDDMVAEVAFAAGARYLVTHNLRDFGPISALGIQAVTPNTFMGRIRKR